VSRIRAGYCRPFVVAYKQQTALTDAIQRQRSDDGRRRIQLTEVP
jgi:hypothetical protein